MGKICKKCVLPESKPYVWLNGKGICNICSNYENKKSKILETDFIKLLNKHKKKGKYDCLVMCSGGKDSISALYYMKKRYKLNPLAFTFDNGFETEQAFDNVKNAVKALGVDFLFFKTDFMNNMFLKVLETNSKANICHLCSIWYMQLAFDTAAKYDIPIIIAGWTKGQMKCENNTPWNNKKMLAQEYIPMAKVTKEFIENYVRKNSQYKNFPLTMEEAVNKARKKHKSVVLSPHWFLPFNEKEKIKIIKEKLKWKPQKISYPKGSTNCLLNFISVYNLMKFYGYTHYHIEMSKLIREGIITRKDAIESLKINFDKRLLNKIAERLGYKFN